MLVNLDCDLQTHGGDYSQKPCVNHGVVADVGVEEVHSLHDSAIEAVRLDSELQHLQDGFFSVVGLNPVFMNSFKIIVNGV